MDEIVAVIVQRRVGGREVYAARLLIPGRPLIATRDFPSREAAVAGVRRRWGQARIVDEASFAAARTATAGGYEAPGCTTPVS